MQRSRRYPRHPRPRLTRNLRGDTVPGRPFTDYEVLGGRLDEGIPLSEVLVETGSEADVRPWNGANP